MKVYYMTSHGKYLCFFVVALLLGVVAMTAPFMLAQLRSEGTQADPTMSVWAWRDSRGGFSLTPAMEGPRVEEPATDFDESTSPFILPADQDKSDAVYIKKRPEGTTVKYKNIGFYDPAGQLQHLNRLKFSQCEYSKCKMIKAKETADAVIFLVARLTRVQVPDFKRKPGQIWVMRTDEAPSRFTWLESLNRTGLREQFNWTITHKSNSDIVHGYGYLVKRGTVPNKDYDKIFASKTRNVAWFVSHCPVRSRRMGYVQKMANRTDVDIFGMCGNLECGTAPKGVGIVSFREKSDTETCFPMLSQKYKFYLAFENSLCQEYVTEKFFKIFNDVDVIPVVRGGADYKSYFPPKTFIQASDFSTPEDLADFLEDLGRDRERYTQYLKNKDKWRSIRDFPDWECKLCEKLHTDRNKKRYSNVHSWWVHDSCHDDIMDSPRFL